MNVRVARHRVDQLLRVALLLEQLEGDARVPGSEVGMALVVEVVQQPGDAPQLLVGAGPPRVGAHRGLDPEQVTAQALVLDPLGHELPGFLARRGQKRLWPCGTEHRCKWPVWCDSRPPVPLPGQSRKRLARPGARGWVLRNRPARPGGRLWPNGPNIASQMARVVRLEASGTLAEPARDGFCTPGLGGIPYGEVHHRRRSTARRAPSRPPATRTRRCPRSRPRC